MSNPYGIPNPFEVPFPFQIRSQLKLGQRVYLTHDINQGLGTIVGIHAPWQHKGVRYPVKYSVSWDKRNTNGPTLNTDAELSLVV
jgi:hypothetical protein